MSRPKIKIKRASAGENPPCVNCGRPATGTGRFIPKDQQAHRAPEGKVRVFDYPVCKACWGDDSLFDMVETHAREIASSFLYPAVEIGRQGITRVIHAHAPAPSMN